MRLKKEDTLGGLGREDESGRSGGRGGGEYDKNVLDKILKELIKMRKEKRGRC